MSTTKLGLPTIDGTMTADVVRDINALAQSVDDKTGSANGLAQLDEKSNVPTNQLGNISSVNYGVATGTANIYAVTLIPAPTKYGEGMAVSVKINADATAASTLNVNGLGAKALKKANGTDVTNLKTNGIYTFRYNTTTGNFILQGEGGSGTAQPGDVLSGKTFSNDAGDQTGTLALSGTAQASDVMTGKTFYNTDAKTKVTGTIPNNGSLGTITPGTANQNIPSGYTSGGTVTGDPDLISANIKAGANIFGVAGKSTVVETADGNIDASWIVNGGVAYSQGNRLVGTIPRVAAKTITPGTAAQTAVPASSFTDGAITVAGDPDLIAGNIKSGVDIFGVVGSLIDGTNMKKSASGSATTTGSSYYLENAVGGGSSITRAQQILVTGLSFKATTIIAYYTNGNYFTLYYDPADFSSSGLQQNLALVHSSSLTCGGMEENPPYYPDFYSRNGEFSLPVETLGTYNWIAIE